MSTYMDTWGSTISLNRNTLRQRLRCLKTEPAARIDETDAASALHLLHNILRTTSNTLNTIPRLRLKVRRYTTSQSTNPLSTDTIRIRRITKNTRCLLRVNKTKDRKITRLRWSWNKKRWMRITPTLTTPLRTDRL